MPLESGTVRGPLQETHRRPMYLKQSLVGTKTKQSSTTQSSARLALLALLLVAF